MTTAQRDAIARHGRNLLAIFPNATEQDPVKLCKKLRRLENQAAQIGLRLCNGPEPSERWCESKTSDILGKVWGVLGGGKAALSIFINRDPRGYALKIDDAYMREHNLNLHRDWGGYGIIAPEIDKDGN